MKNEESESIEQSSEFSAIQPKGSQRKEQVEDEREGAWLFQSEKSSWKAHRCSEGAAPCSPSADLGSKATRTPLEETIGDLLITGDRTSTGNRMAHQKADGRQGAMSVPRPWSKRSLETTAAIITFGGWSQLMSEPQSKVIASTPEEQRHTQRELKTGRCAFSTSANRSTV